jgi:hypothetical protein
VDGIGEEADGSLHVYQFHGLIFVFIEA